ncbi:hypothetical protein H4R24_005532, partial [Coemansia sp. RSA 988]
MSSPIFVAEVSREVNIAEWIESISDEYQLIGDMVDVSSEPIDMTGTFKECFGNFVYFTGVAIVD